MCHHPNLGAISKFRKPNGSRIISLSREFANHPRYESIRLPCGRCMDCRIKHARDWAIRCVGEAKMHTNNQFLTLTFNDYCLPAYGSLEPDIFTKFMKRLRKRHGNGIKYYMCGEYGESFRRPHFHACIFNLNLDDLVLFKQDKKRKVDLYRSVEIERLWTDPVHRVPFGFASVGSVTFDSAAYVARYCTKKINGVKSLNHYSVVLDDYPGVSVVLRPEYARMSRNPGLGVDYYNAYKKEIYVTDSIIGKGGLAFKPPRYFDNLYELECPGDSARVKAQRVANALKRELELDSIGRTLHEDLEIKEKILLLNSKNLIRTYEQGDTIYETSNLSL